MNWHTMTDEDGYRQELDREAVAHARKSWPDLTKVRRVPIVDEPTPQQGRTDDEATAVA